MHPAEFFIIRYQKNKTGQYIALAPFSLKIACDYSKRIEN
jgi:hypothetical protein